MLERMSPTWRRRNDASDTLAAAYITHVIPNPCVQAFVTAGASTAFCTRSSIFDDDVICVPRRATPSGRLPASDSVGLRGRNGET